MFNRTLKELRNKVGPMNARGRFNLWLNVIVVLSFVLTALSGFTSFLSLADAVPLTVAGLHPQHLGLDSHLGWRDHDRRSGGAFAIH